MSSANVIGVRYSQTEGSKDSHIRSSPLLLRLSSDSKRIKTPFPRSASSPCPKEKNPAVACSPSNPGGPLEWHMKHETRNDFGFSPSRHSIGPGSSCTDRAVKSLRPPL